MNATISTLLCITTLFVLAVSATAQKARAGGSRTPVEVSGPIPSACGHVACAEGVIDQGTDKCIKASSTPTFGLLFPYPGINNTFVGPSFVGGGEDNQATGDRATIGGGRDNTASGDYATIGGGGGYRSGFPFSFGNIASGTGATVGGGSKNTAGPSSDATVGGGASNNASGHYATIGGGWYNTASGDGATVGGGGLSPWFIPFWGNSASGDFATVAGGSANTASYYFATVGGGLYNTASGGRATVGGGSSNTASGDYATVGGGGGYYYANTSSGRFATVPGGTGNVAQGNYSFAAGRRAKANHDGAFVWGDSQTVDKPSSIADEFNVYASGGVRMFTNSAATTGAALAPGSGTWSMLSDRDAKENVEPVDAQAVLERVVAMPLSTWNYREQADSIRHMGPMAQDFRAAFGLGVSDKLIDAVDSDGVALAAIQGLNAVDQELRDLLAQKDAEIAALREEKDAQIAELRTRLDRLEALAMAR